MDRYIQLMTMADGALPEMNLLVMRRLLINRVYLRLCTKSNFIVNSDSVCITKVIPFHLGNWNVQDGRP